MWKSNFGIFCLIAAGCSIVNSASIIKGSSTVDGLLRTVVSGVDDGVGVVGQLADDTLPEHGNKQKSTPSEPNDNESDKTVVPLEDSIKVVDTPVYSGSASGRARRVKRSTVEERVKKITAGQLNKNENDIKSSDNFVKDLSADSLDTVELIMSLEEEFGTEITAGEADRLTTVQSVIDFMRNHGHN